MDRKALIYFGGALAAMLLGCQRGDDAAVKKLDEVLARMDGLERKLDQRPQAAPAARAQAARPQRPEPGVVYNVPVADGDAIRGGAHAKVTIVEAFEFACPYCAQVGDTMESLLAKYDDSDLRVVAKHYIVHPDTATAPALAACAADQQGKYSAFEMALWKAAWQREPRLQMNPEALTDEALRSLAKQVGLDLTRFDADRGGDTCKQVIARNRAEMARIGVRGTPSIYINGQFYAGPRTPEAMAQVIDQEIARADAALKRGTRLEDYYASVVAEGKTTL